MTDRLPPYPTQDLHKWALEMVDYLSDDTKESEVTAEIVLLRHRKGGEKATTDGIMMFDPVLGEPLYTSGGVWRKMDGTPV